MEWAGEELELHPERAIYWPAAKSLLLADLHLGKSAHFRKAGIAIPGKAGFGDFRRIEKLLAQYQPERLLLLGDLFHSEYNADWEQFIKLRKAHTSTSFELVGGNHDILDISHYDAAGLTVYPESLQEGPFLFTHIPIEEDIPTGLYNMCGHVHPGVRLQGAAKQSLKLPCFYFDRQQALLPAFGTLTGLFRMRPRKHHRIYVIVSSQVMHIPT